MSSRPTNASIVSSSTSRIAGMKKYVTNNKSDIPVAGQLLKPPAVIAIFQSSLDTRAAVTTKRAELKAALAQRDTAELERVSADDALKGYVTNRFGADSTEAHDFGYAPRKVAVKTVESKQQAIVRNKATREARHTLGKNEKAKIKGTMVVLTASADPANAGTVVATSAPVVVPAVSADAAGVQPVAAPAVNPVQAQVVASTAAPVNVAGH